MKRTYLIILVSVAALLAACAPGAQTALPAPLPTTNPADRQLRVLDTLYDVVNEQYIYEDFGGADWAGLHENYKTQIAQGMSNAEFEQAMEDLVSQLPAGSAFYQTRSERIESQLADTSQYSGIGAYISVRAMPKPHIVILSIIQGSPAEAAGLRAHDSIYSIDGQPVTAAEGMNVVQRVRGEPNSIVRLEVQSPGGPSRIVEVTRATLVAADIVRGGLIPNYNVLYLLFPVIPDSTFLEVVASGLAEYSQRGEINGIILDLRVAHTSADWPLQELLTIFGNGAMGEFYSRNASDPLVVDGFVAGDSQSAPLVIVVGPDTEGSPEVFAAALQAANRATVVGLPTPGKILRYNSVTMPDGSLVTMATSSYKTINGHDLGATGVLPDITVAADWDVVTPANDPALQKALELIESAAP